MLVGLYSMRNAKETGGLLFLARLIQVYQRNWIRNEVNATLQVLAYPAMCWFYHAVKITPHSRRNYHFVVQPTHRPIDLLSCMSVSRLQKKVNLSL
jgi:hypothetical protein